MQVPPLACSMMASMLAGSGRSPDIPDLIEKPVEEKKPASSSSEKLQPPFFVDLSTTLKQMMQAERAHKISSLKIA